MSTEKIKDDNFDKKVSMSRQYLSMRLGGQLFGIVVDNVQDVFRL